MGKDYIELSDNFFEIESIKKLGKEKNGDKAINGFLSMCFKAALIEDNAYIRNEKGKKCDLGELSIRGLDNKQGLREMVKLLKKYELLDEDEHGIRIGNSVLGKIIRL